MQFPFSPNIAGKISFFIGKDDGKIRLNRLTLVESHDSIVLNLIT